MQRLFLNVSKAIKEYINVWAGVLGADVVRECNQKGIFII
jgi:hypothetical protein